MSSRALLRVAAAESPNVKWGGQDIGAYEPTKGSPAEALDFESSHGDLFGISQHVSFIRKKGFQQIDVLEDL